MEKFGIKCPELANQHPCQQSPYSLLLPFIVLLFCTSAAPGGRGDQGVPGRGQDGGARLHAEAAHHLRLGGRAGRHQLYPSSSLIQDEWLLAYDRFCFVWYLCARCGANDQVCYVKCHILILL